MRRVAMAGLLAATAATAACAPGAPAPVAPVPELSAAAARELGFGTVAGAHAALSARSDIRHFVRGSYEVFVDDKGHAVWLFTLPGSAAYPALVRRQLVESQQGVVMRSSVFCEAEPAICTLLQENTRLLDAAIVEELGQGGVPGALPTPAPPTSAGVRL